MGQIISKIKFWCETSRARRLDSSEQLTPDTRHNWQKVVRDWFICSNNFWWTSEVRLNSLSEKPHTIVSTRCIWSDPLSRSLKLIDSVCGGPGIGNKTPEIQICVRPERHCCYRKCCGVFGCQQLGRRRLTVAAFNLTARVFATRPTLPVSCLTLDRTKQQSTDNYRVAGGEQMSAAGRRSPPKAPDAVMILS